jgi:hypothetical protein
MLIPFGILSAAGAAVGFESDYELISTTVLGTATASVTFSSLGDYSSTYKHLQLRISARTSGADGNGSYLTLRFNGDSSTVYASHTLYGSGSFVASFANINSPEIYLHRTPNSTSTANAFGAFVIDILDTYSSTKHKTIRYLSGSGVSTGNFPVTLSSGLWRNTNSVTSIAIAGDSNLVTGSRLSLYGIRG